MRKLCIILALGMACSGGAFAASRSAGFHGIGPRLGFTISPDQFHFGGHIDFGDITPGLMLIPNLEIGVGDNVTTVAPTFELDYRFRADWSSWTPYLGGGTGPVFYSYSHDINHTDLGVYLEAGVARRLVSNSGLFFLEFKLGLVDAPDAKFTAGFTFGS